MVSFLRVSVIIVQSNQKNKTKTFETDNNFSRDLLLRSYEMVLKNKTRAAVKLTG